MSLLHKLNRYFEPKKDFGVIFLRILIGWRLIDGTQDNVFSWERMIEFRDFLDQRGVAYPLVAAHVSVYAQFICGILFIFGAFMRPAAVVMIINFIVAILVAHLGTTFQRSFEVLTMLFSAVFFLFYGAGRISIDKWAATAKQNLALTLVEEMNIAGHPASSFFDQKA